jgi:hypothetical protein
MIFMPDIITDDEAKATMVTAAQAAQATGLDLFDMQRFFHGNAEFHTYGGEPLLTVLEVRAVLHLEGIATTGMLRDLVERWDVDALDICEYNTAERSVESQTLCTRRTTTTTGAN